METKIKILVWDILSLRYLLALQHSHGHLYMHIRILGKIAKQMILSINEACCLPFNMTFQKIFWGDSYPSPWSMGLCKVCFTRVRPHDCDCLLGISDCSEDGGKQTQIFAKSYIHKKGKPKMAQGKSWMFFKTSPRTDETFCLKT